tara:strand:+ start:86 stop:619 length:534 start_codon:yes stop_codon:yes gene_type:complete
MVTKIKEKLSKALKDKFRGELTEQKEKERLERVKANANLKEVTIYTHKDQQHCKQYIDALTNEGIKFIEKEQSEHINEYNQFAATTNMGGFPAVIVNDNYLVMRRDFNNVQQLIGAIQFLGDPNFVNPNSEKTLIEQLKTSNYNLMMRINQLSQQINPIVSFITKLQKELAEEEKGE